MDRQYSEHISKIEKAGGSGFSFYMLIFDSIRLFPEFREKVMRLNDQELKAWTSVVRAARASGEIKSSMSGKQIARLFIFTTDGVGIRMIMEGKADRMKKEIKTIWDEFYTQIKG
jgi:hypothetical protein